MIQPLWKMTWRFLKKLGIKLPYDSAIPLLGVYPAETLSGHVLECSITELVITTPSWKQPKFPTTVKRIRKLCRGLRKRTER